MTHSAEQPPAEHREPKSFDVLASVDMMRFDLQRFGQVLPETRARVYDEELSSIAEGIDRASRTEFVLARENGDLVYFDRGEWRSYTGTLITGNKVAHSEAKVDSRRQFLADWSDRDLHIGYQLRKMQPGEVLSWTNSYPHEQEKLHGAKFLQECGLIPRRKMGFIYRAECLEDGSVVLQSQTVDGSHSEGFAAAMETGSDASMDERVDAYDAATTRKIGKPVYAGRTAAMREENAWDDIRKHKDLIGALLDGIESIAAKDMSRKQLRQQTEYLLIGVWKALKLRLDGDKGLRALMHHGVDLDRDVMQEINQGYALAQAQGDVKVGCGGAISTRNEDPLSPVDLRATFDSIFGAGNGESRSSWKWKAGVCRVEACPTRPGKTKIGPCAVCVRCQAKFDAGVDPTKAKMVQKESSAGTKFDLLAELAKALRKTTEVRV